jgi:23S rRNA (pseudouridine1915-N3)-methyltransferase
MKFAIWTIGTTDESYLKEGISKYIKRLSHYNKIEYLELKDIKSSGSPQEIMKKEADLVLGKLKNDDLLILLDEKGQEFDSVKFSVFIEKLTVMPGKNVVFLIGGAFGHHDSIRKKATYLVSLSKMTFSHQMVRLFLTEQLYRAFTILKNEKYHNI